jgi:hypothetical protein
MNYALLKISMNTLQEKKFFVFILFVYDLCVAVGRAGLLYMHYNYPSNMNIFSKEDVARGQTLILSKFVKKL